MSMARLRRYYSVPAKRGMRVRYTGEGQDNPLLGTITSARGFHLRIRLDGIKTPCIFRPTWELEYIQDTSA